MRRFMIKKYSPTIAYLPVICSVAILYILMFGFGSGYRYPVCAAIMPNSAKYITTGYVTEITDAPTFPIYYNAASKKWCSGKLLTIDGNQYYIPYGDVKVGDAVELLWGSDEKVTYRYSVKSDLSETEIGTHLVYSPDSGSVKKTNQELGSKIATIFFASFAVVVGIWMLFGRQIEIYLEKKDWKIKNKIIPSKFHWVIRGIQLFLILGSVIGIVVSGFEEVVLIFALAACVWIVILFKKVRTTLTIQGNSIFYKTGNNTSTLCKADVTQVYFRFSSNHIRTLVVKFQQGLKLEFDQTEFWGLSSVYKELFDSLSENKSTGDGSESTGDGSMC